MDDITKNIIEITREPSEDLVRKIQQRHRAAGQEATGKTSALLRVEHTGKGFQLIGWTYSGTYEEGRKPGKMPPMEGLIEWAKAKGLTFKSDSQARSWAYCVARKIAREGTERYRRASRGNKEDIFTTPINEMREVLSKQVVFYFSNEIHQTLLRADINSN